MPLSISNSKTPTKRDIIVLLVSCALFCAAVEGVTSGLFGRVSHIEGRRRREFRGALTMRSGKERNRVSGLVVGNSLLLEGVNFAQLEKEIGPQLELRRFVVEDTFYLDWYYGLSHMFRMGAAPDVVVLVLNPIQLTSRAIDGDYSAHFLVDRRDLTSLANDIGADRDKMSSLALANVSFFYATRAEIRTWILGRILPDLPSFTHLLYVAPTLPSGNAFPRTATQRLIQLRELCETYGVQVVLVIPPAVEDSGAATVLRAAKESGVKVLNPIGPAILPASDYSDNFHLNSRGAGKFTPALASALKETLLSAALQSKSRSRDDSARETGATAFPWNLEDHAMEAVNAAQGR